MDILYLKMIAVIHEKFFTQSDLNTIIEHSKMGLLCILQLDLRFQNFKKQTEVINYNQVHIWILLENLKINLNDKEIEKKIKKFDGRSWYKIGFLKFDDIYVKLYAELAREYGVFYSYGVLYSFPVEMSSDVFEFVVDSEFEIQNYIQYYLSECDQFYLKNCRKDSVIFTSNKQISKYPFSDFEQIEECQCIEILGYMKTRYQKYLKNNLVSFLFCQTKYRCFIEVIFSDYKYASYLTEFKSLMYDLDIIRDGDCSSFFCDFNKDINYNCNRFIFDLSFYSYFQVFDFIDEDYYRYSLTY